MIRPRRHRRARNVTFNRLLPNILTTFALCAGMTSIRLAIDGRFELAAIAILIAAVLDTLDGRVARLLKATSPMGAQLDSLSDFVCFGVAPALMIYFWSIHEAGQFGWAVVLIFSVCAAMRLARFNVQLTDEDRPPWASSYFTGVPSPAGAGLAMLPIFFFLETGIALQEFPILIGIWTMGAGLLMVSTLPTFSLKSVFIPAKYLVFVLVGMGLVIAGMITATWLMLLAMGLAYLVSIPLAWRRYQNQTLRYAATRASMLHRGDEGGDAGKGPKPGSRSSPISGSDDDDAPHGGGGAATPAARPDHGVANIQNTDAGTDRHQGRTALSDRAPSTLKTLQPGVYPISSRSA